MSDLEKDYTNREAHAREYFQTRDPSVMRKIIMENKNEVGSISTKLLNNLNHFQKQDLIQEGNIGMIDALMKYDPAKGPFIPYMRKRVKGAIIDAIRRSEETVRRSRTTIDLGKKISGASEEYFGLNSHNPTLEQLSDYVGEDSKNVKKFLNQRLWNIPLDYLATIGEGGVVEFDIPDDYSETPLQRVEEKMLADAVWESPRINDRDKDIVRKWIGFGEEPMTMKEIGKEKNITEARVSQIINEVLYIKVPEIING